MLKKIIVLGIVFLFSIDAKSQSALDVAIAAGNGNIAPSFSFTKLHSVSSKKKFKIGYGVRLNGFSGKNQNFVTAPAKLTTGSASIGSFFAKPLTENFDTLRLENAQTVSLNALINLQYSLKKLDIGFGIDALGLTFGGSQNGTFFAKESTKFNNSKQTGSPTTLNALLIGDSDRGTLNSELYARYWLTERLGLRAGASFQFIEFTTAQKLTFDNDRFRLKTLMPFIAVSIKL